MRQNTEQMLMGKVSKIPFSQKLKSVLIPFVTGG